MIASPLLSNVRHRSRSVARKFSIGGFAFLRGPLRLCRRASHSKNWQKLNWFIVFHVSIWGAWSFLWGRLSPQKRPRDNGTAQSNKNACKSSLLTRLNHISPSCWTVYRSFEIHLEMGNVHWIGLQTQCSIQIHCFKKHYFQYELCFKNYLIA